MSEEISRRTVIKKVVVAVGGATVVLALPERWVKPVVESIVTPANAGFSPVPPSATTTPAPTTTTPAPTTTTPAPTTPPPTTLPPG
jgi:hypothetical protein